MNLITIHPHPAIPGVSLICATKGAAHKQVFCATFPSSNERREHALTTEAMALFAPKMELHFKQFGFEKVDGGKTCVLRKHYLRPAGGGEVIDKLAASSAASETRKAKAEAKKKEEAAAARKAKAKEAAAAKKKEEGTSAAGKKTGSKKTGTSAAPLPLPGESAESTPSKKATSKKATATPMTPDEAKKKREAGRKKYVKWLKAYKQAHPSATADQIKKAWAEHKGK